MTPMVVTLLSNVGVRVSGTVGSSRKFHGTQGREGQPPGLVADE